jgi:hypothetical protein
MVTGYGRHGKLPNAGCDIAEKFWMVIVTGSLFAYRFFQKEVAAGSSYRAY